MKSLLPLLAASVALATPLGSQAPGWTFTLKGNSGIVALESIVVSPTLVLFLDLAADDPLQIDGHSAWGALWDLQTSQVSPLNVVTNGFCASGAMLSNGSMVSVGGFPNGFPGNPTIENGTMGLRIFEPCADPAGVGCTLFEDPLTFHLAESRYYPSTSRIPDGSLMIVGGSHINVPFYNIPEDAASTVEFFPPKFGGVPRPSEFLKRSLPSNMFPRQFVLPDGKVFMVANNQSIIYDIETGDERILPDIPNGVRVTNPFDGSAILLPLSPPNYTPEVLVCGGTDIPDTTPPIEISSQRPGTDQCSRILLTEEGIKRGWVVERMLEARVMPELLHMPNGQILIVNGAGTGVAGSSAVHDPVGNSNADNPVFTPSLYSPNAPVGRRIHNNGMPTTDIARMYHSSATLTPQGNFLIAGNNPNNHTNITVPVNTRSEFRVETLDPPFMFVPRPRILDGPEKIGFGKRFTVPVSVPDNLQTRNIQVALVDLGFSSHAFHSSARLVFMDAHLSNDRRSLSITAPPNPNIYPPGPAYIFLTIDGVTSEGQQVMVGTGASPPQTNF
ncbi:hypothetical protein QCA50_015401 [Cerrena zonata]|uniref:Glyoxal oxidase n=1 Tax=Cerrena zonata TaxID=2478898 RepID=A0AAW0FNE8_9APHY